MNRLRLALQSRDVTDLSPVPVDASSRDVAQVARAVNALFGRVSAGVSAQREFAGNVAHELRNPPRAGIGRWPNTGCQDDPPPGVSNSRRSAERQASANHLIDQLLALAFADGARDTLAVGPVDIGGVVERSVLAALPRIDANQGEIVVHGLDALVLVEATKDCWPPC